MQNNMASRGIEGLGRGATQGRIMIVTEGLRKDTTINSSLDTINNQGKV